MEPKQEKREPGANEAELAPLVQAGCEPLKVAKLVVKLFALRDPAEATSTWLHALHIACKDCICRDVRGAIVTRFMHVFWSRKLASKCA